MLTYKKWIGCETPVKHDFSFNVLDPSSLDLILCDKRRSKVTVFFNVIVFFSVTVTEIS